MDDAYDGRVRKRHLERTRGVVVFSLEDLSDRLGRAPTKAEVDELLPDGAVLERLVTAPPAGDRRLARIWGYITSLAAERSGPPLRVPAGDYAGLELSSGKILVVGDGGGAHHLGEEMGGGVLVVFGAGDYLGQGMRGGGILARSCGDYAFRNMSGGWAVVTGDAGNYPGLGNRGGRLAVKGNVGHRAGWLMHSGRISVGGNSGDYLGMMMSGGRIFVRGRAGARAGWRAKGGSIVAGVYGPEDGEGAKVGVIRRGDP